MIIEPDFLDHWKTRLLMRLLDTDAAPNYVIRLWSHCQTRKTNIFPEWSPAILSSVCRWPGDADLFWSAMLQTFCRVEDGYLIAHQWDEVNASLIAAWSNGGKGGRPKKPTGNPRVNPEPNQVNPQLTHGVTDREDREEKTEKTLAPKSPSVRFQNPTVNPELEAFRLRIGAIVRRRHDTPWNTKEMKALKEVFKLNTPEEDIQLVEARYKTNDPYLRRELYTLLNNWNGEVDKVRSGLMPGIGESRAATTSLNISDYQ
jgi:hypothetical protein